MKIKVSVIVPVYNAENYLEQCIQSVQAQTLTEIEIICVNDGSTDNSLSILQTMQEEDNRIIIISQENLSAGAARNRGIEIARGEYLSILDADDFFEKDMLKCAYEKAISTKADVVVFRSDQYDEKEKKFLEADWVLKTAYLPDFEYFSHHDVKERFFDCFMGWPWDKLFKTNFIKTNKIRFQHQKSVNDMLFVYSALAKADRISVIKDIFAHKRINNEGSITSNYDKSNNWECSYNALIALKNTLISWDLYEEMRRDYVNYALFIVLFHLKRFVNTKDYNILFDKLNKEWLKQMDILGCAEEYFYDQYNYERLKILVSVSADEYRRYDLLDGGRGEILFPFDMVDKHSKIVLYGAGKIGIVFWRQIAYSQYCNIVKWVDKNYLELGMGIECPSTISDITYDKIVIAVKNSTLAGEIVNELKEQGVDIGKIIWKQPVIRF